MIAYIDGDILTYRAAFAAERTIYTCYALDPETGIPLDEPFWNDVGYRDMQLHAKEHEYEDFVVTKKKQVDDVGIAIHNVDQMMERIVQNLHADPFVA